MNHKNKQSHKKLRVTFAAKINEQVLDYIHYLTLSGRSAHDQERKEQIKEIESDKSLSELLRYQLFDNISEEDHIESISLELIEKLQIIGLYLTLEKSIRDIMKESDLFSDDQIKNSYYIKNLKKAFEDNVCDLTQLGGFNEFEELRLINNCIKHGGYVNDKLAEYSGWTEGQEIISLNNSYIRLRDTVIRFVSNIKDEVIQKID